MAKRVVESCGGNVTGKTIAVLGLTFKPNTDDMRESPSLVVLPALIGAGARIQAFDPEGMGEAAKLMPHVTYCARAYEAMIDADAVLILTAWTARSEEHTSELQSPMRPQYAACCLNKT